MAKRSAVRVDLEWYGDQFLDIVRKYGDEALFAAGEVILDQATRNAPVGPRGNLRRSGYISTASRSTYKRRPYWRREKKPPKGGATIAFSAPHAHLVEGGRRSSGTFKPRKWKNGGSYKALKINGRFYARSSYKRVAARPFVHPAVEQTRDRMVEALARALNVHLEREMPK